MKKMTSAYIGLMLSAAIWGVNFGISRMMMNSFSPVLAVFLRFAWAVPFLFIILKIKEGSIGVNRRDLLQLIFVGIIGISILEIAVMYSVKFTTLASASLLNVAPWPIFTSLFSPFFTKERITARLMIGGAVSLVGVALIILGAGQSLDLASQHLWGDLLAFGVSILGALYNLICVKLMRRYSSLRIITWFVLFGVLFIFPFTIGTWGNVHWAQLTSEVWIALAYNVLFCTVLAFMCWNYSMGIVGATRANFVRYLVPAAAVITGYIMFKETITFWQVIGGILICCGLIWICREKSVINMTDIPHTGGI